MEWKECFCNTYLFDEYLRIALQKVKSLKVFGRNVLLLLTRANDGDDGEEERRHCHAHHVAPPPPEAVAHVLPDENGRELSQGGQSEVDELQRKGFLSYSFLREK